jgi:hypothetical protein
MSSNDLEIYSVVILIEQRNKGTKNDEVQHDWEELQINTKYLLEIRIEGAAWKGWD